MSERAAIEKADGSIDKMEAGPGFNLLHFAQKRLEHTATPATYDGAGNEVTPKQYTETLVGVFDESVFPSRAYRDQWREQGGVVVTDMALARAEKLDELRVTRKVKFEALDAEWMKAMGQGDSGAAATAESKRQALRDLITKDGAPGTVQPAIDGIDDPDELKAYLPVELR